MVGIMAVAAAQMVLLLAAAQKGVLLHDSSRCARHLVACFQVSQGLAVTSGGAPECALHARLGGEPFSLPLGTSKGRFVGREVMTNTERPA
jgi:hypothetical protein